MNKIHTPMNWLKLEQRIRDSLAEFQKSNHTREDAIFALRKIDDVIGEETGRGYELEV